MKQFQFSFVCFWFSFCLFAQEQTERLDLTTPDTLYREDQLYFGFHINLMHNLPSGVRQTGLSGGIMAGFIRDIPFNKQRNWALGLGGGISANTYGHNLLISRDANQTGIFRALDQDEFTSNRFSTYIAEVPFQIRWRTSTPTNSSFYRIYAGFNLGYMYHFRTNFANTRLDQTSRFSGISELNRWRTGIHLSFGSNFVNFHVQYNFNSLFDANMQDTGEAIDLEIFKFGFIFYVL